MAPAGRRRVLAVDGKTLRGSRRTGPGGVGFGLGALLRHPAAATSALFAVVFLAYGVARAVEGWSYLPSRLLLSNADDVVAQVHAVAAKPRLPSLELAYLDLALYCTVALGLGAWRSTRDT